MFPSSSDKTRWKRMKYLQQEVGRAWVCPPQETQDLSPSSRRYIPSLGILINDNIGERGYNSPDQYTFWSGIKIVYGFLGTFWKKRGKIKFLHYVVLLTYTYICNSIITRIKILLYLMVSRILGRLATKVGGFKQK